MYICYSVISISDMQEILLLICAYLLGSIPTAVWISKHFFGFDIRNYGSGNAGATNTFRVLGKKWGCMVMSIDILKGFIATSLWILLPYYAYDELARTNFMLGLGLIAVVGHIFPVFANFKGGKGVATLFGMIMAIQPMVAILCVGIFLIVLYLTRIVSLSSIVASISLPVFILLVFNAHEHSYRIFALVVAALVLYTHQKNIIKMLNGMENKVPIFKKRDQRKNRRRNQK
jgi:acyl phosphate:glycerol-3-phosphate acyltransferase